MNLDVYKGKRVFVTGHTGFKGSWLCEMLLMAGAEVYGYALKPPTKPALFNQLKLAKRIKSHVIGDIRDLAALTKAVKKAKPDFVFHLAAQPLVRESYAKPVETFETNVMGTVNLLEAVRRYETTDLADLTDCGQKCGEVKTTDLADLTDCGQKCGEVKTTDLADFAYSRGLGRRPSSNPLNPINPLFLNRRVSVVCITTDKCYENRETKRPYREDDPMGGYDPYSCSKGCDELLISSYRRSFFNSPDSPVWVASARAGNVIGGGDWAKDRIVPDAMRAWIPSRKEGNNGFSGLNGLDVGNHELHELHELGVGVLTVRNSKSTRPWQHVLEPLCGYLTLGAALDARKDFDKVASGFNFGPNPNANRSVRDVVEELLKHTPGKWVDKSDPKAVHEAGLLNLDIRKAKRVLGWKPRWNFEETIAKTSEWYDGVAHGVVPLAITQKQIQEFLGEE